MMSTLRLSTPMLLAAAATISMVACSGSDASSRPTEVSIPDDAIVVSSPPTSFVADLAQRRILEDGVVDTDEAETAAQSVVDCAALADIDVEPKLLPDGTGVEFKVNLGESDVEARQAKAVFDQCYEDRFAQTALVMAGLAE